jgi:hypothetical protein
MDTPIYPPIPYQVKDIRGQRFARLVILEYTGSTGKDAIWLCQCDCGTYALATSSNIRSGSKKSCGCLKREINGATSITHGMSHTKIYRRWRSMLARCNNPSTNGYQWYGGIGIAVCPRWANSFEDFLADVGMPPTPSHSLDRIDSAKNYEPSNVRWATWREQARHRSNVHNISFQGETLSIIEWSEKTQISYRALLQRFSDGWSVERALTTPVRDRGRLPPTTTKA